MRKLPVVGRFVPRPPQPTFRGVGGWHPDLIASGINANSYGELTDYMDEVDGKFEQYRRSQRN